MGLDVKLWQAFSYVLRQGIRNVSYFRGDRICFSFFLVKVEIDFSCYSIILIFFFWINIRKYTVEQLQHVMSKLLISVVNLFLINCDNVCVSSIKCDWIKPFHLLIISSFAAYCLHYNKIKKNQESLIDVADH